jgi:hypothetical protein
MTSATDRKKDAALAYFTCLLIIAGRDRKQHLHTRLSRILAGPSHFADALVPSFQRTPLPAGSVRLFALAVPWAESIVGLLVLARQHGFHDCIDTEDMFTSFFTEMRERHILPPLR